MREQDILARLVGFATITGGPNLALIDWAQALLTGAGFTVTRVASRDGQKAGLLAKYGAGDGGVLFSAHSDVVPVAGQDWTGDPFTLTQRGDWLVGRGATDMKGFLACVLARAERVQSAPPLHPMRIALSWDEELGCLGIPEMIDHVLPSLGRPDLVIVGEPTSLRLCTGHKGKAAYRATCRGEPGHSAMAPQFTNALHLAADLVQALRAVQARLAETGAREPGYEIGYSTLHVGKLSGGVALNMVPELATVDFEIRHVAADDPAELLAQVIAALPEGVADRIAVDEVNAYPGLAADPTDPAIAALATQLDDPAPVKVSYGTEAGFFAALGLPTVVCGPGDMADGHQPNESIATAELSRCTALIDRLTAPADKTLPG